MKNILIKSSAFLLTSLLFLLLFFTFVYTNAQEVEEVSLYSNSNSNEINPHPNIIDLDLSSFGYLEPINTNGFKVISNDIERKKHIIPLKNSISSPKGKEFTTFSITINPTNFRTSNFINGLFNGSSFGSFFYSTDVIHYTFQYSNFSLDSIEFDISNSNSSHNLTNLSFILFAYEGNLSYDTLISCVNRDFNPNSIDPDTYNNLLNQYNTLVSNYNDLVAENQQLEYKLNEGYNILLSDFISLQEKYNKLSSAISSNYFNNDVVEFVNFYNKLNDELLISYPVSNVDSDGLLDFSFILDTIKNDHGLIECYAILKYKNYAPVKLINGKYIAQSFCDVIFYNDNEIISSFGTGSDNNIVIVDNSSYANDLLINKIKFEFGELSNTNMLFYYDTHLYDVSKEQFDLGYKKGYDSGFLSGSSNYSFFNLSTGLSVKFYDDKSQLYKTLDYSLTELLNSESKPLDIANYSLSILSSLFHLNNSFEILADSSGEVIFYYDKGSVSTDSYNFFVLDGDWDTTIDIYTWNGKVYSLSKIDDVSSIYLTDNDYIRSIKFNVRYIANFSQSILKTTSEYTKGYQTGYDKGHTDGFNEGSDTGYKKGWDTGYASGSDYTYNKIDKNSPNYLNGYNAGRLYQNANGGDINSIVYTFTNCLFSSPINILKSCLNFDFFGINLFSLFTSLITICLCFWVIRIFLGKK